MGNKRNKRKRKSSLVRRKTNLRNSMKRMKQKLRAKEGLEGTDSNSVRSRQTIRSIDVSYFYEQIKVYSNQHTLCGLSFLEFVSDNEDEILPQFEFKCTLCKEYVTINGIYCAHRNSTTSAAVDEGTQTDINSSLVKDENSSEAIPSKEGPLNEEDELEMAIASIT